MEVSFKTRVKLVLEECALDYLHNYIGKKYVVYSSNFTQNAYYIIDAKKDNYLHLTGVITNLKASVFFDKCIARILEESDFDLGDKSRKGSIRKKIKVLKTAVNLFDGTHTINVEERFIKNKVVCSFATSDGTCTLGFILDKNSKPLTLLKGNMLRNPSPVDLIVEKGNDKKYISKIIFNKNNLNLNEIVQLLSLEMRG
ncbi:PBECR4 domain-containing protein [Veillonella sp. VA137]|uniref:PBECR4 domain-containing protein n=1 Tax=Veillonella sp. VA137 TaxID=741828 RepID=UPI000F8DD664|nr:PBECR4 domain-containing protein [Veillonella sp. VA137]